MKQAIAKRVTFTLDIKIQNHHFPQVYRRFLSVHFQPLLVYESTDICHHLNTENQRMSCK